MQVMDAVVIGYPLPRIPHEDEGNNCDEYYDNARKSAHHLLTIKACINFLSLGKLFTLTAFTGRVELQLDHSFPSQHVHFIKII